MRDLPVELLRTFVAVAETGTMAKAAGVVSRSPSAVSLQMTRLANIVAQPLFRHGGRAQGLTHAGETLLGYAREIIGASERALAAMSKDTVQLVRFGTVEDLADTVLPSALAEFAKGNPEVGLDVHVGASSLLLDEADAGKLDFVLCFQSRRARRVVRRESLVWLGRRSLVHNDPLPVAILQPACELCEEGVDALRRVGRRYNVVLRTPSLSGLRAALDAGLAVGCRTPLLGSGNIQLLGAAEGLPALPEVAFAMQVPRALTPAARRVAGLVRHVIARGGIAQPDFVAGGEPATPTTSRGLSHHAPIAKASVQLLPPEGAA